MTHEAAPDVRPIDSELGGDADAPNLSLEMTTDDIDDIAFSPEIPSEDRRRQLSEIRDELQARAAADGGDDMHRLLDYVVSRIAAFDNSIEAEGALDSVGMDTTDRADDDDPADSMK